MSLLVVSPVHRLERKVHIPFELHRCTGPGLVGRLVQTNESSVWVGPPGTLASGPVKFRRNGRELRPVGKRVAIQVS